MNVDKETFLHFVEDVGKFFAKKKDVPTKLSQLKNDLNLGESGDLTEVNNLIDSLSNAISEQQTEIDGKQPKGDYVLRDEIPEIPSVPVQSVNGKTGAVVLSASDVGALPSNTAIPTVPTNVSAFTNDAGYLKSFAETDPTVPAWAKAESKPSYTKSEVGLGNVDNVKQYSANNPPPYPVTSVNNKTGAVTLSASDVGADASGTANSAVSTHNSATNAHSTQFATKLNKSGDTMEGALVAQTNANYTTRQVRNVIYLEEGADIPTTQNGDLVLFYK